MPVYRGNGLHFTELAGRQSANPLPEDVPDPCSVRVVRVSRGPRTPHLHPHSCEVVYVAEGEGRFWEGEQVTPVRAGDVVLVPTGVPHATVCTGPTPLVLVCFFPHRDLPANLTELGGPVRA